MSLHKSIQNVLHDDNPFNNEDQERITAILDSTGASIEDACGTLAGLMASSDMDQVKLNAAKEVLNLHGVNKEEVQVVDNRIQIIVNGEVSEKPLGIFNPKREIGSG